MDDQTSPSVAIETLGCKLNTADSERLAREFIGKGYTVVDSDERADIYIVNTCTVTHRADRKARQAERGEAVGELRDELARRVVEPPPARGGRAAAAEGVYQARVCLVRI